MRGLPEDEFFVKRAAKDGLNPYCKPCDKLRDKLRQRSQRMKQYYRDHPEKKEQQKAYATRITADPERRQKIMKYQVEYKKRRVEEAKQKALRVSRKLVE